MTANPATIERARLRLDAELAALDGDVSCRGPRKDYWTSDEREERVYAAVLCKTCPVLDACANYADVSDQRWHVWAGVDRGAK